MKHIIGKKSYSALIVNVLAFLSCGAIVSIVFVTVEHWVVRFVVSFVFGIGSLFSFVPIIGWILTPKNLIIVDETQITLISKKVSFQLCEISSVSGFEHTHGGYANFWDIITKFGYLTIYLKNGAKFRLKYLKNVLEVENNIKRLISKV